jgi:rhodanese-related sulfurtransferase
MINIDNGVKEAKLATVDWKIYLIPYDEISDKTVNIDKNKTILVYCRSGKRATTAVEKLKSLGYTAYNMGGLDNIDLPKK